MTSETRPQIEVLVAGSVYSGWESVRVTRSLQAISGSFTVRVSDRDPWPILPGHEVEVRIGDRTVITGYVDRLNSSLEKDSHTNSFSGRDRTADLVDSVSEETEFLGLDLGQVAAIICKPFGIRVIQQTDVGAPFDKLTVNQGETAFQTLERASRMRGVLLFTLGDSVLQIDVPGSRASSRLLAEGANVTKWGLSYDHSQRYQTYIVKGQQPGSDDFDNPVLIAQVEGRSSDREITRYRPMVVLAEGNVDGATAQARAEWEASLRAARGTQIKCTVPGWFQFPEGNSPNSRRPYGELWQINTLVNVNSPTFRIKEKSLLLDTVVYELDLQGGTTSELTLVRADAYKPNPAGVDPTENPLQGYVERFDNG